MAIFLPADDDCTPGRTPGETIVAELPVVISCPQVITESISSRLDSATTHDSEVRVTAAEESRLTLKQKLDQFDPERHGGEAMATVPAGNEVL